MIIADDVLGDGLKRLRNLQAQRDLFTDHVIAAHDAIHNAAINAALEIVSDFQGGREQRVAEMIATRIRALLK